jgi:hypothetical protein
VAKNQGAWLALPGLREEEREAMTDLTTIHEYFDEDALSEALYDYVYEAKAKEGAKINNAGVAEQLAYLTTWMPLSQLFEELKDNGVQKKDEEDKED